MFGRHRNCNHNLRIDGIDISRAASIKFLGVIISEHFKWKEHITIVANKIAKSQGVLNKVRHILPVDVISILYCTLILPYYQYCNIVWVITQLIYIQKFTSVLLVSLNGIITLLCYLKDIVIFILDINKHQIASFMYKFINNQLPSNFNTYFKQNEQIHDHDTCKNSNINIIHHSSTMHSFTITVHGPRLQNSFEPTIKLCPSLASFKDNYKKLSLH